MHHRFTPLIGLLLVTLNQGCAPEEQRDPRLITSLTAEMRPVVASNNALAVDMYGVLSKKQDDFVMSPLVVTVSLGMLYAGAAGETAAQFETLLNIEEPAGFHSNLGALTRDLAGDHPGRGYQLHQASGVWLNDDVAVRDTFRTTMERDYGATLAAADFFGDHEQARADINEWVGDATEGHIPALFPVDSVHKNTKMVLANALYFKADWQEQFNNEETVPAPFYKADGTQVMVDMMRCRGVLRTQDINKQAVLIEIDYKDEEISLVVLLPFGDASLDEVEDNLTIDVLDDALARLTPSPNSTLRLPKLSLNSSWSQREVLQQLGLIDPYDFSADFSMMLDPDVLQHDLFVQNQPHAAFLRLDEQGAEAAAASGSTLMPKSTGGHFVADRPFAFIIRDRLTGTFLLTGRVASPAGK